MIMNCIFLKFYENVIYICTCKHKNNNTKMFF